MYKIVISLFSVDVISFVIRYSETEISRRKYSLSVPTSRVLILEDGTDRLSRIVGTELPLNAS
jgi:hypothetical protein